MNKDHHCPAANRKYGKDTKDPANSPKDRDRFSTSEAFSWSLDDDDDDTVVVAVAVVISVWSSRSKHRLFRSPLVVAKASCTAML